MMTSDLPSPEKETKRQNHKNKYKSLFQSRTKISFIYRGTCVRQKQKGGKTGTGVKRKKPAPDLGKEDTLLPII